MPWRLILSRIGSICSLTYSRADMRRSRSEKRGIAITGSAVVAVGAVRTGCAEGGDSREFCDHPGDGPEATAGGVLSAVGVRSSRCPKPRQRMYRQPVRHPMSTPAPMGCCAPTTAAALTPRAACITMTCRSPNISGSSDARGMMQASAHSTPAAEAADPASGKSRSRKRSIPAWLSPPPTPASRKSWNRCRRPMMASSGRPANPSASPLAGSSHAAACQPRRKREVTGCQRCHACSPPAVSAPAANRGSVPAWARRRLTCVRQTVPCAARRQSVADGGHGGAESGPPSSLREECCQGSCIARGEDSPFL